MLGFEVSLNWLTGKRPLLGELFGVLEVAERAVEELDGIISWLTYYSYLKVGGGDFGSLINEAVGLVKSELESFLASRVSKRYRVVLNLLAGGVTE